MIIEKHMEENKRLLIIGAGGHGRVVADVAEVSGEYSEIAFADDSEPIIAPRFPIYGDCNWAYEHIGEYVFIVAIGNGSVRQRIVQRFKRAGAQFATLVHPSAVISPSAAIGEGSVIMPGVIVNADTRIGNHVILNTSCSVDHDCDIDDYVHISVGARLCGSVCVGESTWIGAGATVVNNVSVCGSCMIGAGAVVVKDILCEGTYKGIPAR